MSAPFLGEWRQVAPDPAPAAIFVTFEPDGALRYRIEYDRTRPSVTRARVVRHLTAYPRPRYTLART